MICWRCKFNKECDGLKIRSCKDFLPRTNGDRIRAMTDEELSAFLGSIVHDYGQGTAEIEGAGYVIDDWLAWLREEATL